MDAPNVYEHLAMLREGRRVLDSAYVYLNESTDMIPDVGVSTALMALRLHSEMFGRFINEERALLYENSLFVQYAGRGNRS